MSDLTSLFFDFSVSGHCLGASEGCWENRATCAVLPRSPGKREIRNLPNVTLHIRTITSQEGTRPSERHSGGPAPWDFEIGSTVQDPEAPVSRCPRRAGACDAPGSAASVAGRYLFPASRAAAEDARGPRVPVPTALRVTPAPSDLRPPGAASPGPALA